MVEQKKNKYSFPLKDKTIWVAGQSGMVGSALHNKLLVKGYKLINSDRESLDLTNSEQVSSWFKIHKPEVIFLVAAKVGGILSNLHHPADFIRENLSISLNIIENAWRNNVKKLIYFGSSCIYPKNINKPINEKKLLSGCLEETNEPYAIAKISGIKMCQAFRKQYNCDFISLMPTNIYGPNDNFNKMNSHVIAALVDRFHNAALNNDREVIVWGTGKPKREFLYVEDLADASLFLAENYSSNEPINVGTGIDLSIKTLAYKIKKMVNYGGRVKYDMSKPDGIFRKVLDVSRINNLGWSAKVTLDEGLKKYYKWYKNNLNTLRVD